MAEPQDWQLPAGNGLRVAGGLFMGLLVSLSLLASVVPAALGRHKREEADIT